MKPHILLALISIGLCHAQETADEIQDPTRAGAGLKAAMMSGGSAIPSMNVGGIVIGGTGNSAALMLEIDGGARVVARPGVPFQVATPDGARKLVVKRITADGIEVEEVSLKESAIIPAFGPPGGEAVKRLGEVAYAQFSDLPLMDALRMLGDQTGENFSASVEANKCRINLLLSNVAAANVIEEICKSHNLWFKRDANTGITRIMTVGEFEKDLAGFREERTEVFTLKYPNVAEVATAIANLYGNRVELSFGAEDLDEDMRMDLEGRFDRYDVLTQRTQQAGAVSGNVLGNNVNGFYSSGGNSSSFGGSGSYGGSSSGRDGNFGSDRLSRRRENSATTEPDVGFRDLTPDQAERVDLALSAAGRDGSARVEALRKSPSTIYVTASRRNNMIAVRSADGPSLDAIKALVERMDVQTPMVMLEVKVVSIELGDEFQSAFDFRYSDGKTSASIGRSDILRPLDGGSFRAGETGSQDMTFTVVGDHFRARMQLFEEKRRIKTLATPTLVTANNEVSRLFLGEERPLVRGVSSQTIITDNNVATTPNTTTEFRNVGNTLLITPNINADRTVTLRLVQENSFIDPNAASIPVVTSGRTAGNAVENVKVDVVNTRSVSGTFVAKDRMAIAIGGMIEDKFQKNKSQVPVLGDIPILGIPFQARSDQKGRRELVVIIRPHIMLAPGESKAVTEDHLRRNAPDSHERLKEDGFMEDETPASTGSAKDGGAEIAPEKKPSLIEKRRNRFFR
jgi:general secretion pathway protein D